MAAARDAETTVAQYVNGEWQHTSSKLAEEMMLSIFVNKVEFVSILCTPEKLSSLVVGFLRSEGLISSLDEITRVRICFKDSLAEVQLNHEVNILPQKRVLTSGCGGGTTFEKGRDLNPIISSWHISPAQVLASIRLLRRKTDGPEETDGIRRGVHASALSDGDKLIIRTEDIGRHNTLDKIWGECMLKEIPTENRLIVTTGRISSEMLIKTAKMEIPVVASINSATSRAVELAGELGITLIGYARGGRMTVYTGEERLRISGEKGNIAVKMK